MIRLLGLMSLVIVAGTTAAGAQQVLSKEPPRGTLRFGESVLVESRKCPKGQVMQVTGGRIPGRATRSVGDAPTPRQRNCVARP